MTMHEMNISYEELMDMAERYEQEEAEGYGD